MKKLALTAVLSLAGLAGCAGTSPVLGLEDGHLTTCSSSPNCVSSEGTGSKHFIEPLQVAGSPLAVKQSLLAILEGMSASNVNATEDNYIRAEFTSKLFGFVDDAEFYISTQEPLEQSVHLRSAARIGYSDLGVNRKRIELIREKLKTINGEN